MLAPEHRHPLRRGPERARALPVGTVFPLKTSGAAAAGRPLPGLTLPRGSRHVAFLPDRRALLVLRGELGHKNLWSVDLDGGTERKLTEVPADFDLRDFDVSPDGRELVLARAQEQSEVVLVARPRP